MARRTAVLMCPLKVKGRKYKFLRHWKRLLIFSSLQQSHQDLVLSLRCRRRYLRKNWRIFAKRASYASAAYATTEALWVCLVRLSVTADNRPVFRPVPIFLSLRNRKNTEWILMTFTGGNHNHEQIKRLNFYIKWLHFRQNSNRNKGTGRGNIRIDVNQSVCRDVKQVLTPSEWIHQFHCTD